VFDAWHCSAPLGPSAKAVRLARKRFPLAAAAIGACELPAATAQAICKKEAFKRAEKESAAIRTIPGCQLVNWSDRNIRKRLLQIYDAAVCGHNVNDMASHSNYLNPIRLSKLRNAL